MKKPNIADIVRSMFALGFSAEEVLEILSLSGIDWESAQNLIDRLKNETDRISTREDRIRKVFEKLLEAKHLEIIEKLSIIELKLNFLIRASRSGRVPRKK